MAISNSDISFEEELERLQAGAPEARFSNMVLSGSELQQICDAVRKSTTVQEIILSHTLIGDTGAQMVADAIRDKPQIRDLNLGYCGIGDAGVCALADSCASLPNLELITLHRNPFGDEGALAIASLVHHAVPNLIYLYTDAAAYSETGRKALEHAALGTPKRTLLYASGMGDAVTDLATANIKSARGYIYMAPSILERLKPENYWDLAEQKSAIHYYLRQEKGGVMARKQINQYAEFVASIPELDLTQEFTLDDLFKPFQWDGSDWEMQPIHDPKLWQQFDQVISRLNEQGNYLQEAELLDENGKPNALFELIMQRGKSGALFTEDNWTGATVHELQSVIKSMPDPMRELIPNRHALVSSISRSNRGQAR